MNNSFATQFIAKFGPSPHTPTTLNDGMFSPENVEMFKSIELCAVGLYLHTWKA